MGPPAERLAISVEPHRAWAEARQCQPETAEVLHGPEEPGEPGCPGYHRAAQAGLGDVREIPGYLGSSGCAGDLSHVDGTHVVTGKVTGGLYRVARQAERSHKVAPRASSDDPEDGVRGDRLIVGEHPVDH